MSSERMILAWCAALSSLAEHGVPTDIQELLTYGDTTRGIKRMALQAAIKAAFEAALSEDG